jgi:dUTP pyrophosphatase
MVVVTIPLLLIKQLDNNEKIQMRGYNLPAEIDLMANQEMIINSRQCWPVNTRIILVVPLEIYVRIVLRSGLIVKHGIDIGAGVIDEDY